MFPLSVIDYVKVGLCILLLGGSWYLGYRFEHLRFTKFQDEVQQQAAVQEAKVEALNKQHQLVTKGIQDEYEAKLAAVRNYYKSTSVWNNPSSSKVSGLSLTSQLADAIASYNGLALRCSETTLQLVELQKWINEQVGIK